MFHEGKKEAVLIKKMSGELQETILAEAKRYATLLGWDGRPDVDLAKAFGIECGFIKPLEYVIAVRGTVRCSIKIADMQLDMQLDETRAAHDFRIVVAHYPDAPAPAEVPQVDPVEESTGVPLEA